MSQVTASIYIDAPVAEVFSYVADYRNSKNYLVGFNRFEPVSDKTQGLGARVYASGSFHGMPVFTYLEIVDFVPNQRIVSRSSPSVVGRPTWLFEPHNEGTKVTFSSDFKVPLPMLGRFIGDRLLEGEVRRHVEVTLGRLKQVIEGRRSAQHDPQPPDSPGDQQPGP